jgi:chitodextrinase
MFFLITTYKNFTSLLSIKKGQNKSAHKNLTNLKGFNMKIKSSLFLIAVMIMTFGLNYNIYTAEPTRASIAGSQYTYHSHYELPDAISNMRYVRKINVTLAVGETFQLIAGQVLPAGLSLNSANGIISGVPTVVGPNKFGVQIGSLNYVVHLMVLPAAGEVLKPNYYDEKGTYSVYQESITVNFAVNELPYNKNTSLGATLTYPTIANNSTQVASGRFPIISIMHGSGYQGGDYTQLSKILASHGFIVIAPTITTYGSYYSIWQDWQIIQRRGYETILNMDLDSGSKFYGHANREAIGLIGHSWGGATTELNMFMSPARAFVFIDDIALFNNLKDWNQYFNCFSEPDPFPAKPSLILKGGSSNYINSCVEFEGAFTGPRFMATFNNAEHENFLNVGFNGGPDLQKLYVNALVSKATNRNAAHQLVAFFKRYLADEVEAGANLYAPFALTQASDITTLGGSLVAFRPDWAGQLLIDDFSKSSIATNNLGLPITSNLNATIAIPYIAANELTPSIFNLEAITVLNRAQYRHLHIEKASGSAAGIFTENLGTTSLPLDASFYTYLAFEISQKDNAYANTLPITIELTDVLGAKFELPLSNSLPASGFKSRFSHSILLPLNGFIGVNSSKLKSVAFKVGVPSQDIYVEIDNLRFERIPTINNLPPVISDQAITMNRNESKSITLAATDKNGNALTYSIFTPPSKGTISLSGNNAIYTPNFNYEGYDQIKFKANDGLLDSNAGIVDITVLGPTQRPTANNQTLTINDLNSVAITLTGSDVENNPLTYTFLSMPSGGSIYGELPNLTYTPWIGYHGSTDTLTFKVNSGKLDSEVGTITINYLTVNHAPNTYNVSATTSKNRSRNIKLNARDDDNNPLIYTISSPLHGSLSGTAPDLVYTPTANYSGTDTFTYSVNDGTISSNTSTVSINVNANNAVPYGTSMTKNVVSGFPVYLMLNYYDSNSDPLTVSLISGGQNGITSALFPLNYQAGVIFTPDENFVGTNSIIFKCNDGLLDSANATITLNVVKPKLAPIAINQNLNAVGGIALNLTLTATDPNNDLLYYEIVNLPAHGTLTGTAPNLIYTANTNYTGPDGFLFKSSDGKMNGIGSISINATAAPDTTAPSVPAGLAASAITQTSLTLSWSASSDAVGVTGYKIYKGGVLLGTSAITNTFVTGLTANTNYSFTVSAYDAAGNNSAISNILTVKTLAAPDTTAPSVPAGLAASAITQSSLTLSWSASSDAVGVTGYKIYKGGVLLGTSAITNTFVTGLTANTNYSFTVSAYDAAGNNSAISNILTVKTLAAPDTTAPSVPASLAASAITQTSLTLSWSASSDAVGVTGYKIYKGGVYHGSSITTNSSITGLTANTNYSFTVSAYDAAGNNSVVSSILTVKTLAAPDTTAPSVPASLAASAITQTSLTLSWSASSDAVGVTGYKIYKGGVYHGSSITTNSSITGLTANTNYSFTVSAYDAAGNNSVVSSILAVTTLASADTTPPSKPYIGSAFGISSTKLTISWQASTDNVAVTGYKVFQNGSQIATSVTNQYTAVGLAPSTNYIFSVSAYDAAGNNSVLSNLFSVSTTVAPDTTPPSIPSGLSASLITQNSLKLAWNPSTDNSAVAGYKVYKDGVYLVSSIGTNCDISGLTANTTYLFSVSAYDAVVNNSSQSNPLSVKTLATPDTVAPSVPTGLAASLITQSSFTLSWTPSTDAVGVSGYKIFKDGQLFSSSSAATYVVSGLAPNTNYSFTVSAFDAAGNNSAVSSVLAIKTLASSDTTPPTPPYINSAYGINQTKLTLSWVASTDNIGVTGYKIYMEGVLIGESGTTTFTVTGLTGGTSYNFTASAYDAAGNISVLSNIFNVKTIPNRFTLNISAGPNGSITPEGSFQVYQGANRTISVTPNNGYQIDSVFINEINVGAKSNFSIYNISSDYKIYATFKLIANAISTSTSLSGSVTPTGSVDLNYGGSQSLSLTPTSSYTVEKTLVDGFDLHDFNQSSFSFIEIILNKNQLLQNNKSNKSNLEVLQVYRMEGSDNLTVTYEISLVNPVDGLFNIAFAGEIQWDEADFSKKVIEIPALTDDDNSYDTIAIKIVSVENKPNVEGLETNVDSNQANNETQINTVNQNSSGGSGGCNYVADMSNENQLGNILIFFGFFALFFFRKNKRKNN